MSGWNNSDRRARLPKDWQRRVNDTKDRAGGRCEALLPKSGTRCPRPGAECDHIIENDDHGPHNLQWLCHVHHQQKTIRNRPSSYSYRRPKAPKRPAEQHPSLSRGTLARTDLPDIL